MAVGSPFGSADRSVTAGIVSAEGRQRPRRQRSLSRLVQFDAAVNPGNSGGPLVGVRGEVVGVNTLILGQLGFRSVSFAISQLDHLRDCLRGAAPAFRQGASRWLGVALADVTRAGEMDAAEARRPHAARW